MYKFFVNERQIVDNKIILEGPDVNHIKNALRLKVGKLVLINDGQGFDYISEIKAYNRESVELEILKVEKSSSELPIEIHLYQGLPKKDKMEFVIQKAVELGVTSITPVIMKRSIVKLDANGKGKKTNRWQKISSAAAKQAKRDQLPTVHAPVTLEDIKEVLKSYDHLLVPYEHAKGMATTRQILSEIKKCDKIGVVIGPEGGFDDEEINKLVLLNAKVFSLGKRILRTETASLAVLSYLMIKMEEV